MGRLRHEAGQTIVLFAVLLPLFLGLGAIAVDIGYWYVVKKTAQDAADAAALAAARELPVAEAAITTGEHYVHRNMPDATASVATPYWEPELVFGAPTGASTEQPMKIEVTVTQQAVTFFGRIFGLLDTTVRARAVAERLPGNDNLAIFAGDLECDGAQPLEFSASNVFINGFVHANGRFRISDGPFWAADGTHNMETCPPSVEPAIQSQFGEDRPPPWGTACSGSPCRLPREGAETPWPMWFTPAELGWPNCTYQSTVIHITGLAVKLLPQGDEIPYAGGVIPTGTYCATDSVRIDGDGLRGQLTVLAPEIEVTGDGLDLTSYSQDVLFYAVPNADQVAENDGPPDPPERLQCIPDTGSDMILDGSGSQWQGIVFNPCGRISVGVDDSSIEGAIIGNRVHVLGDAFEMIGKGDFEYRTALVE